MPVTRISAVVDWSTNGGASAWMGAILAALIGPRSSIGSPVTFIMRPRVPGPTGILIGAPVSWTSLPRTRPSVPKRFLSALVGSGLSLILDHRSKTFWVGSHIPSMAMQRTTFSPKCWATSKTNLFPFLSVLRALRIGGNCSPSNF